MGAAPIIAAVTIMFCMMMVGIVVGHSFGWHRMDCIFLGGMIAMSSTTIIYKAFDDMGLRQQRFAGLVMSVLILEDIPPLSASNYNEAKRFVTLIDALYEAKVRLICSAADEPERLYIEGTGAFEFERTASRLREMQGADWGRN